DASVGRVAHGRRQLGKVAKDPQTAAGVGVDGQRLRAPDPQRAIAPDADDRASVGARGHRHDPLGMGIDRLEGRITLGSIWMPSSRTGDPAIDSPIAGAREDRIVGQPADAPVENWRLIRSAKDEQLPAPTLAGKPYTDVAFFADPHEGLPARRP